MNVHSFMYVKTTKSVVSNCVNGKRDWVFRAFFVDTT